MEELLDDIIEYHFKNQEHIFVQELIKKDKKFAEAVYFELQMQMYLNDCDEQETITLED